MIVADTDVIIDALRGREPARRRLQREIRTGQLATTSITVFELTSGTRDDSERERVERLLSALTILSIDEPSARQACAIRRELEAKGAAIGTADYLIAGVCLSRSAVLLTRNREHFERVEGLTLGGLP